jgi:hypothetical protein
MHICSSRLMELLRIEQLLADATKVEQNSRSIHPCPCGGRGNLKVISLRTVGIRRDSCQLPNTASHINVFQESSDPKPLSLPQSNCTHRAPETRMWGRSRPRSHLWATTDAIRVSTPRLDIAWTSSGLSDIKISSPIPKDETLTFTAFALTCTVPQHKTVQSTPRARSFGQALATASMQAQPQRRSLSLITQGLTPSLS